MLLFIALCLIFIICMRKLNENYYIPSMSKRIKTVDRNARIEDKVHFVQGKTIFGNVFDIVGLDREAVFTYFRNGSLDAKGKSYIINFPTVQLYIICTAEESEEFFQSTEIISKGFVYWLLEPFLGDGLLLSTGKKWHSRRKILTPAFHFNILQGFNEIFKEESLKFVEKLNNLKNQQIDVFDVISEFSLNNICETAMGIKLDKMPGSREYRQAIHHLEERIMKRTFNPVMYPKILYYLFGDYSEQQKNLKIVHDFSSRIIEKRREDFHSGALETSQDQFGKKKRYAMLDTLLQEESQGNIDHSGICEEVDTFMFEGYDTTSTCLMFTIFNLALYQDVQEKCRKELQDIDDFSTLSIFDFNKLDYLECVIKESLRLFPPVPFIARYCSSDTQLNGLIFPKNAQICFQIFDILRDPKHFANPNEFQPERFYAENTTERHPFAFVPFSAGSRNCIGQKFAMLEIKSILVALLKNFRILPVTTLDEIVLSMGLILRTKDKIYVKFGKLEY